jgi:PAS domain S-box-containing protein
MFVAAIGFLVWIDTDATYQPRFLLPALNLVFSTGVSLVVAYLAATSYLAGGARSVLFLGCGVLSFGMSSGVGGIAVHYNPDVAVTVFNTGAALAGLCHLLSALSASSSSSPDRLRRPVRTVVAAAYCGVLAVVFLVTLAAWSNRTPHFFLPEGPTAVRQSVLGTTVGLFALAAILFRVWHRRSPSAFMDWYSLALGLIAVGLWGVLHADHLGSPLAWLGRTAQFAGGIYMFVAVVAIVLDFQSKRIPLGRGLAAFSQQAAIDYRPIVEAVDDPTVSLDESGCLLFWNPAAERKFGRSLAEVFGVPLAALVAPAGHEAELRQRLTNLPRTPEGVPVGSSFEAELQGAEGPFPAELTLLGSHDLTVCIIKDITQRRHAEEALRQARDDLERHAGKLRLLAAELTQAEQRERRRLAQVLHDQLQQLLVAAQMKARLLSRANDEDRRRRIIAEITELIGLAIDESRSLTLELSPPVLHDRGLAGGLEWLARQLETMNGLTVETQFDDGAEPDDENVRIFLFQAVRELLLNVVKHAGAKTAIIEMSRLENDWLQLSVSDTGMGIDPAKLNNREGSGGFGLFSIRERLEVIGGRLRIESEPGEGTQISIELPRGRLQPPADVAPRPTPGGLAAGEARQPGERVRVLLADDHAVVRQGLAGLLREHGEIEVVGEAVDGAEAVDLALRLQPDVVLMDITMPALNGIDATERIMAALPQTRVIGLSMHEEADMGRAMLKAGAQGYLRKDTDTDSLLAAILQTSARERATPG